MDFDTEKFITEVQNRPAIWNQKLPNSDKLSKQREWEEVAATFRPGFSKQEQKRLAENLQKKWRNIRDSFVKAHKTMNYKKAVTGGKRRSPYMYYEHLLFLKDTIPVNTSAIPSRSEDEATVKTEEEEIEELSETASEADPLTDDSQNYTRGPFINDRIDGNVSTESNAGFNRRIERSNVDNDDDDRLFFLSLVKEFKRIPDHMQIQTKLDILRIIKDAQFSQ